MKTADFLDALRSLHGSDYRTAKVLGVRKQQVSRWRTGEATFGDEHAQQIAELLGLDPAFVLASMQAERAAAPGARAVWERIAATFAKAAGVAAVAIGLTAAPSPAKAAPAQGIGSIYIMSNRRRPARSILAAFVGSILGPLALSL